MTTTPERHAQSAGGQTANAQNGPWTVIIAEDHHRPTSYILYVKSECPFNKGLPESLSASARPDPLPCCGLILYTVTWPDKLCSSVAQI